MSAAPRQVKKRPTSTKKSANAAAMTGNSRHATSTPVRRTLSDIDVQDRQIVRLLQEDGRISNASIARAIGTSEPTVRKRIDRLVSDKIIKVTAIVNPANSGYGVDILMGIRTTPGTALQVGGQLGKYEQVLYLGYTTGRFDLIANMLFRSDEELFEFFSNTIAKISGIVATESFTVMRAERVDFDWKFSTKPAPSSES